MREYDVVVIGSGGAGLTAALSAASRGLQVLVVEAADTIGGTTALSGGALWVPDNHRQSIHGITDSIEQAATYLDEVTDNQIEAHHRENYLQNARSVLREIENNTPIEFAVAPKYPDYYPESTGGLPGGRTVEPIALDRMSMGPLAPYLRAPYSMTLILNRIGVTAIDAHAMVTQGIRGMMIATKKILGYLLGYPFRHRLGRDRMLTLGSALVAGLAAGLHNKGVAIQRNTKLHSINYDEQQGVTGITVATGQAKETIAVRQGLVLAAGGFSRNNARKQQFQAVDNKPANADWGAAVPEDQGDPMMLAIEAGAKTAMMDESWWMPITLVPGEGYARSLVIERSMPGCIIVDQAGKRFVNESTAYEDFVRTMREHFASTDQEYAWCITDNHHRFHYPCGPLFPGFCHPQWLWTKNLKNWMTTATSVAELAQKLDLEQDALATTITEFNTHAANGQDPQFGRGDSTYDRYYADASITPNPCLKPIEQAPYYAFKVYPGDLGTKGGLVTTINGQVVGANDQPMPKLYAVGNTASNPLGNIYPGAGGTLGPGLTYGWLAGQHIGTA